MSSQGTPVTLDCLAQQQAKLINEMADQRADMAVLLAITQRMDVTMTAERGPSIARSGGAVPVSPRSIRNGQQTVTCPRWLLIAGLAGNVVMILDGIGNLLGLLP